MARLHLSESEKHRHLLRRFGLGATQKELADSERRGLNKTIDRLINYERFDEDFHVSPWAFFFNPDGKVDLDPPRVAYWWAVRMIATKRPLQENLTLFWHDHFAVSASKVLSGPIMLDYNETLRRNANGNFRKLLGEISREPAMLRWLDTDNSIKAHPNENFARELLELFTLGEGHYTERDIKEAARVFTGWGLRSTQVRGLTNEDQIRLALKEERSLIVFSDSPGLRDHGVKTILGKTGRFEPDDVFDMLVATPQHAKFLVTKLWEWFAYTKPEAPLIERLAQVYVDAKFEMKPLLLAIATADEFWSERSYRRKVKNPVDFLISVYRQAGLAEIMADAMSKSQLPTMPVDKLLRDVGAGAQVLMARQGMRLLYPPDVAGWESGESWLSTASVVERLRIGEYLLRRRGPVLKQLGDAIGKPETSPELVELLASVFDVPLTDEGRAALTEVADKAGGPKALEKPATATKMFGDVIRLLSAIPDYQFC